MQMGHLFNRYSLLTQRQYNDKPWPNNDKQRQNNGRQWIEASGRGTRLIAIYVTNR